MNLKAPFPAFGGKRAVASIVWQRLGNPRNYIEPFCFSAAMLLSRPDPGKVETINDVNPYVSNFWRAVQADAEAVAVHADWPVNETDLHARHRWLVFSEESLTSLARVKAEPDYYDAKVAGWWAWGACCWIGSGWCEQLPHMSDTSGRGVTANGPSQQVPRLSAGNNQGLNSGGRIQLADAFARGRGVNGNDSAGTCEQRRAWLTDWMRRLADRLRPVRVCCGHWNRVCDSPSTLTRLGLTGVFLDPPYRKTIDGKANRHGGLYANDKAQDVDALCDEVQAWCLKWGGDEQIRIALCGYEGEYDLPGWDCVPWKSAGGYGNQSGKVNENAGRERLWFSPHCLAPVPKDSTVGQLSLL